jgi:hypothetical protein
MDTVLRGSAQASITCWHRRQLNVQEVIISTQYGDGEFNTPMRYGTFAAKGGGEDVEPESLMGGQTISLEVKYSSQHRRRVRTMGRRVYAWVDCMRNTS